MATIAEHLAAKGFEESTIPVVPTVEEAQPAAGMGGGIDLSFLTKPTGPGSIEDYLDHPMNAPRSRGLAQALRGATGLFGEGLRAALADVAFGTMEYMRERKVKANVD